MLQQKGYCPSHWSKAGEQRQCSAEGVHTFSWPVSQQKGVAPPHVQLINIFKGVMPFLMMVFLAMALLYLFPEIALWLPVYFFG